MNSGFDDAILACCFLALVFLIAMLGIGIWTSFEWCLHHVRFI